MAVKTRRVQLALLVVLLAVLAFLVWTTSATVRTLFQPRIDLPAPVPNAELPLPTQAAHLFWSGRYEAFEQLLDTSLAKTAAPDEIERVLSDTCDNRSAGKGEAERWLTRMPNRSWPQLCLGRALVQSALAARGKELSVNTTPEKFRRMHVLFDDAAARLIPFYGDDRYRRAVTIPLLTLIQFSGASALANIGSYDAVYERTHSAFPGMQSLYWHRIENLRPQWGGSLKAMQAFAAEAKVRGATAKTTEQLEALVTTTATAEQWRGNPQQPLAVREAHIALPLSVDGFEILASDLDRMGAADSARKARDESVRRHTDSTMPLVRRGYAFLKSGDALAAYRDFVSAANRGDYWALDQVTVVLCYGGNGYAADTARLRPWIEYGASIGHGQSEQMLATFYLQGIDGAVPNHGKALELVRRAAQHGYANAQHDLGTLLLQTAGTDTERGEAVEWLRAAAKQNHRFAREKLAKMGMSFLPTE